MGGGGGGGGCGKFESFVGNIATDHGYICIQQSDNFGTSYYHLVTRLCSSGLETEVLYL
jgi:hypothetical protein